MLEVYPIHLGFSNSFKGRARVDLYSLSDSTQIKTWYCEDGNPHPDVKKTEGPLISVAWAPLVVMVALETVNPSGKLTWNHQGSGVVIPDEWDYPRISSRCIYVNLCAPHSSDRINQPARISSGVEVSLVVVTSKDDENLSAAKVEYSFLSKLSYKQNRKLYNLARFGDKVDVDPAFNGTNLHDRFIFTTDWLAELPLPSWKTVVPLAKETALDQEFIMGLLTLALASEVGSCTGVLWDYFCERLAEGRGVPKFILQRMVQLGCLFFPYTFDRYLDGEQWKSCDVALNLNFYRTGDCEDNSMFCCSVWAAIKRITPPRGLLGDIMMRVKEVQREFSDPFMALVCLDREGRGAHAAAISFRLDLDGELRLGEGRHNWILLDGVYPRSQQHGVVQTELKKEIFSQLCEVPGLPPLGKDIRLEEGNGIDAIDQDENLFLVSLFSDQGTILSFHQNRDEKRGLMDDSAVELSELARKGPPSYRIMEGGKDIPGLTEAEVGLLQKLKPNPAEHYGPITVTGPPPAGKDSAGNVIYRIYQCGGMGPACEKKLERYLTSKNLGMQTISGNNKVLGSVHITCIHELK